ncbi:MAG: ABC transporter substrate-binding protein [Pseudomonadota bacterium]
MNSPFPFVAPQRLLRRRAILGAAVGVALLVTVASAVAAIEDPVERLHEALLEGGATFDERFDRLLPVVEASFDFATMSRAAVGAAWTEFGPATREAVETAFARYSAASYARNFADPAGLAFTVEAVRPADDGRSWVDARLDRPGGEPVRFEYLVHDVGDGPHIINVIVGGGLNELARRRSEFRSLLDAGGSDGLLEALGERTEALRP